MHELRAKFVKNLNQSTYNAFLFLSKWKFVNIYFMYLSKALPLSKFNCFFFSKTVLYNMKRFV